MGGEKPRPQRSVAVDLEHNVERGGAQSEFVRKRENPARLRVNVEHTEAQLRALRRKERGQKRSTEIQERRATCKEAVRSLQAGVGGADRGTVAEPPLARTTSFETQFCNK